VITGSLSISCADEEKATHSNTTIKIVDRFISKPSTFEYKFYASPIVRNTPRVALFTQAPTNNVAIRGFRRVLEQSHHLQ
jgi:hypothetical protein